MAIATEILFWNWHLFYWLCHFQKRMSQKPCHNQQFDCMTSAVFRTGYNDTMEVASLQGSKVITCAHSLPFSNFHQNDSRAIFADTWNPCLGGGASLNHYLNWSFSVMYKARNCSVAIHGGVCVCTKVWHALLKNILACDILFWNYHPVFWIDNVTSPTIARSLVTLSSDHDIRAAAR